jgi:hypothetical protein
MNRHISAILREAEQELTRYEREHGPGSLGRVVVDGFGADGGRVVRMDGAAGAGEAPAGCDGKCGDLNPAP